MKVNRASLLTALTLTIWGTAVLLVISTVRTVWVRAADEASLLEPERPGTYTSVLQGTIISKTGERLPGSIQSFGVRRDGSFLQQTEFLGGVKQVSERTIYLASGLHVLVDDLREVKMSVMENGGPLLRDPRSNCLNSYGGKSLSARQQVVGEETIGAAVP
ncbi:MAG: hypothetical protein M3R55_11425 [Acidobacteriota bacterium]|nr:hypothetical protein [Acidobacteriota bacterium]